MEVVNFDEYVKQTREANAEKEKDIKELLERAKTMVRRELKKLFDSHEVGIPHPLQHFSSMTVGLVSFSKMFDLLIEDLDKWYINEDSLIEECQDNAISEVIKEYNLANSCSDYGLTSCRNYGIVGGDRISFVLFDKTESFKVAKKKEDV